MKINGFTLIPALGITVRRVGLHNSAAALFTYSELRATLLRLPARDNTDEDLVFTFRGHLLVAVRKRLPKQAIGKFVVYTVEALTEKASLTEKAFTEKAFTEKALSSKAYRAKAYNDALAQRYAA